MMFSILRLPANLIIIQNYAQFHNVILGGHKMAVFWSATGIVKEKLHRKLPDCVYI
jgi:hypothetical protein